MTDAGGSGGVRQRVPALLPVLSRRADVSYHDSPTVAAERLPQQSGQLAVSVVDITTSSSAQRVDHVAERQERAVDVSALQQSLASVLCSTDSQRVLFNYIVQHHPLPALTSAIV